MAVSSHLQAARDTLLAMSDTSDLVAELLASALQAPMGEPHREAIAKLLPATRRLRHEAMDLAATIGAAEAVR